MMSIDRKKRRDEQIASGRRLGGRIYRQALQRLQGGLADTRVGVRGGFTEDGRQQVSCDLVDWKWLKGLAGSRADDVTGGWQVEAEGPPGCLRVVAFHPTEDNTGLDIVAPIVVEGELVVIRHPARGQFPAVVEVQVREARRGR